jgi:glycosyltransferase involved in cell wall biosynthesis
MDASPPDHPLVSVLCPTRDRRSFLPLLLDRFQAQTWPADRLELIVADDGADPIADALPADPRIRLLRFETRLPLGTKRNALAEAARGTFCVHFDDDDWHPADRVARAVAALADPAVDVVGKTELAFWDLATDRIHVTPPIGRRHVTAGSMAYRRSYWEAHRFMPDPHTEERQFLQNFAARVAQLDGPAWETVLALAHGGNTLPKNPSMPRAPITPADIIPDAARRAALRALLDDGW